VSICLCQDSGWVCPWNFCDILCLAYHSKPYYLTMDMKKVGGALMLSICSSYSVPNSWFLSGDGFFVGSLLIVWIWNGGAAGLNPLGEGSSCLLVAKEHANHKARTAEPQAAHRLEHIQVTRWVWNPASSNGMCSLSVAISKLRPMVGWIMLAKHWPMHMY
jgi:hypothetical protein